jgi:cytoplasmic iron level regulating protein YaaA (DUF328/UPF0246 family)
MPILAYLSPAKSLRFGLSLGEEDTLAPTQPRLLAQSIRLARAMQVYDAVDLAQLMDISDKLAQLNKTRFLAIDRPLDAADPDCRRSAFCFDGDAYEGLEPESLSPSDLARLNRQVRFLSGYYGVLRPSDLMRAYRLEMGRKPVGIGARSLYDFWGADIAKLLISDALALGAREAISLASEEYDFSARAHWSGPVALHRTRFESDTPKGRKVVSFDAKRARGLFARHLALSLSDSALEAAESFLMEGWSFESASAPDADGSIEFLFVRRPIDMP